MTPEGNDSTRTPGDDLLARLYQQGTDRQAARYAATYDVSAGLARFNGWLTEHTAVDAVLAAIKADAGAIPIPARPAPPTGTPAAAIPDGSATSSAAAPPHPGWSADCTVTELYSRHYQELVRLALLLVRDTPTAEDVVQDAFVAMHAAWARLQDEDNALAYLRRAVVNRCRSVLRHQMAADLKRPKPPPDMPSAEYGALVLLERSAVLAALGRLPDRQREAIVLRYYRDLSEDEIAAAMGISRGAVKSHTARGMAALRAALKQVTPQPAEPADSEDAGPGQE